MRPAKILLVLLLIALVPLRAAATVTIGFCAFAHEHGALHGEIGHDHAGSHAADDESAAPSTTHGHGDDSCGSCAEHCSSASLAPNAVSAYLSRPGGGERTRAPEFPSARAVGERLDRPPLSL